MVREAPSALIVLIVIVLIVLIMLGVGDTTRRGGDWARRVRLAWGGG
jgi:hypothetical protein